MIVPSSLDSAGLARRLGELAADERDVQVEFLLHLDEFDRRRAYLELGFGSLWDYCLKELHLREGAAGRRIGAMRVLRRFPRLEGALREGRLCLSTASLLGQVLTDDNLDDLVARAAYKTKAEVDHLVASVRPRVAPVDGIRKLPAKAPVSVAGPTPSTCGGDRDAAPLLALAAAPVSASPAPVPAAEPARSRPPEVRPVSEDEWSVRVTFDSVARGDLETLKALLSHKIPDGALAQVLHEAIRCGIEKHGNRRGATAPARPRGPASGADAGARIPTAVRREVWKRDGGACTWKGDDGRRCGSTWQVEIDHVRPPLLGGSSEPRNLRLLCRSHNMLHAEHVYGREQMDQYRKGEITIAGDSSWSG